MTRKSLVRRIPRNPSILSSAPFFNSFDRFFTDDQSFPVSFLSRAQGEDLTEQRWRPAVDVHESEAAFHFTAELPGLTKEDIEITLDENNLTLKGERKFEEKEESENYHRIERSYGSFTRSFSLPGQVDTEKVTAEFKNGVLHITVPKTEQALPKKITID